VGRFNWAHRRRSHVFQGRFKSALIRDEGRLEEVTGKMPGVQYGSLAQGVRQFWRLAEERGELKEFVVGMRDKCK